MVTFRDVALYLLDLVAATIHFSLNVNAAHLGDWPSCWAVYTAGFLAVNNISKDSECAWAHVMCPL